MNTNAIRKHYDQLTTRERLTALMAADLRDDDDEARAILFSAGPHERWKLNDLHDRLGILAVSVALSQWRQAALLLFLAHNESESPTVVESVAIGAYTFVTCAEAWRALCKEYGIDGAALMDKLDCDSDGLTLHERICREVAFTQEEAAEALQAKEMDAAKIITADSLLSCWRRAIEGKQ